jgi:hypothetical protein
MVVLDNGVSIKQGIDQNNAPHRKMVCLKIILMINEEWQ